MNFLLFANGLLLIVNILLTLTLYGAIYREAEVRNKVLTELSKVLKAFVKKEE